jgi:hypothetical protein
MYSSLQEKTTELNGSKFIQITVQTVKEEVQLILSPMVVTLVIT